MNLDGLIRAEAGGLVLETVRIAGMVLAAPLAWTAAPMRVRAALVLLLAVAAHGPLGSTPPSEPLRLVAATGSEFLLGLGMGFVVRIGVSVAEIAAEQIAPMMGLGIAQIFDPQAHATENVLATLLRNLAILLGLVAGLHRIVIGALLASFRVVPAGSLVDPSLGVPVLTEMTIFALSTGVRVALPMIAILTMTQVALAFVSRAAPAMQVFSVGFAVTMATGGLVLVLVLPDLAHTILSEASRAGGAIEALVFVVESPH